MHFLDQMVGEVKTIKALPESFETMLRGIVAGFRSSTKDINAEVYANRVEAMIPELVGAGIENTSAASKSDEQPKPTADQTGINAPKPVSTSSIEGVPGAVPNAQTNAGPAPATADSPNQGPPPNTVTPTQKTPA